MKSIMWLLRMGQEDWDGDVGDDSWEEYEGQQLLGNAGHGESG